MNKRQSLPDFPFALLVTTGQDKFGKHRRLGISKINFKVTPQNNGEILIIENTFREKGGPTFESTASPSQRGYAEPAIVNTLVEMMNKY